MTVSGDINVSIDGGSPWGFRLQGGGNFPLQVLKVRKRSKAQRHLIEGDIIIKVNGIPANGKTHEAVMDMVDATVGQTLNLEIYRGETLQKIPKKAAVPTPLAAVAPASQKSTTSSSVRRSEHTQHRQTTEESMSQKKMSSQQQMSQKSTSVLQQQQQQQLLKQQQQKQQQQQQQLQQQQQYQQQQQQLQQQQQQQQQVTKSNIVLKNQAQQQQKVTQIQQSSQWQEMSSQQQQYEQQQQQQHLSLKQRQKALQHQQMLDEQQRLAQQQFVEQQMILKQLAEQRQHAQTQHATSEQEQESVEMMQNTSSVYEQSEEQTTTSVSTAVWTSGQSSSLDQKQTNLVRQAYTSSPKPFKPKVAGHLPLRESQARSSPTPSPAAFDDKENLAPSPVPKPPTPAPNVPQFNVKNVKNIVNQNWSEVELHELNLPVPDYSKKITILPHPDKEPPPPMVKKTIVIPDMTIKPGPPVAPKPKRVLSEVQPEPFIPDHEIIPIYTDDRPKLPVFGPPVMYGLNPAFAPKRSTSMGEEESMVSETSSGSRRNDPNYESKKQKIYSDSSFYYDPKGVYPTIEDQIDLCKKISQSLTATANTKARGATMFAKRQKRSIKWIHDGYSEGNVADLEELCSELDQTEGGTKPLFQFRIPKLAQQVSVDSSTKMSLSREEFETLRMTQPKVDHTAVNANACMSIVSDLQNSKGRGAKLFAKRQARCDKWVIDDKTSSVSAPATPCEPPCLSPSVSMMNAQNRLADMITKPMPIIQPKPSHTPKAPLPDPPKAKKNMGVPLPTVNANLQAELKNLVDGPNFNRTARGWNAAPTMPQPRAPRAQSVQPSSTKGPPPPVAPKPGKCMKYNPRPTLRMGDEQPPVHYRSSSDQLRLLSPRDPYHDASGYCSDVDHRTKVYAFKKPGICRPNPYFAGPPMSQPVYCSLPGSDL